MGDTLELFRPLCNGSVRVESRTEKLTGDAEFLLLREALDVRVRDDREGAATGGFLEGHAAGSIGKSSPLYRSR